jgi:hypothetical protein
MTDEATESKKPTGSMTTILVVLAGMLLLSLASLYMLNSRGPVEEAATARAAERMQARLDIAEEEKERMTTYGWADQAAQKVRMPLDQAMKNMLPRFANLKPVASGELAPLAPGPSDAPVLRAEPAQPDAETASDEVDQITPEAGPQAEEAVEVKAQEDGSSNQSNQEDA